MSDDRAIETAWRIHGALVDWTGKVDTKASFALTLESAVIGGVVAMSTPTRPLGAVAAGVPLGLYRVGVLALMLAAACAVAAVIPRTRWNKVSHEAKDNFVYFGHVRTWDADDLAHALRTRDVLPVLTRQHVAMSKIAYQKHLLVQVSLGLALIGSLTLLAAAQLP